ncbi:MAG: uroporphyrinogen decarboxylase [Acidobacteria bacterium]|nr:uroporphyrinogen decarboxylase [Acidobacteriota bacterium]
MPSLNDRFLRACRREPVDATPVWFMRQAGRFLPEYRKLREKYSLLTMAKTPDLAAQVTLMPLERLGVDAAILFADILLPVEPMGIRFDFEEGTGPLIHNPVRSRADVERLQSVEVEEALSFVVEAVRILRRELENRVPLIGFAGAPFTLASYLIEGGSSRSHLLTKSLMYRESGVWHGLMDKLSEVVLSYLRAQVRAGAQAVQLFDSWVGCLSPGDYREYVLPYSRRILQGLEDTGVPRIHFGTETGALLEIMTEAGGEVMAVDWRVHLDEAWSRLGDGFAIQGNLDPAVLLGPFGEVRRRALEILRRAIGRPGHIFNLGHGVLPQTPVENVVQLVELVHHTTAEDKKT